ncbi:MAG: hypothetical protein ACXVHQ_27635 [Solirubrobacteraceae bacterium]
MEIRVSVADATGSDALLRRLAVDGVGSVEVSIADRFYAMVGPAVLACPCGRAS